MPCLLAIDTTTDVCGVALLSAASEQSLETGQTPATDRACLEDTRLAPRLHSRIVLAMLDGVLRAAGTLPKELGWIAFSGGPGSFTGVRVGAAVAQGIALGVGAKVIVVPSAAVTAESARRQAGLRGDFTVSRLSRPGWRYVAQYAVRDDGCECLAFDRLVATETSSAIDGEHFPSTASTLARLAWQMRDDAVAPALAQPFYVEGDSPWQPSA